MKSYGTLNVDYSNKLIYKQDNISCKEYYKILYTIRKLSIYFDIK